MAGSLQVWISVVLAPVFLFIGLRLLQILAVNVRGGLQSKNWPSVQGILTRTWVEGYWLENGRKGRTFVNYQYAADGISYRGSRIRYTLSGNRHKAASGRRVFGNEGQPVRVFFDPDKPNDSVLEPGVFDVPDGIISSVFGLGFLLFGIWIAVIPLAALFSALTVNPMICLPLFAGSLLIAALLTLKRISYRSGVTDGEIAKSLPGDDLLPEPQLIMDRAATFNAPVEQVWPWIAQLGKGRAGWYFPRWLERLVNRPQFAGLRRIEPSFQNLSVGEDTPDWGPGDPVFRVALIDPPHALVYLSRRDPAATWTWPASESPLPPNTLELSWALILEQESPGATRLLIRLRMGRAGKPLGWNWALGGGFIDYVTIVFLFAGLRERLRDAQT